MSTTVLNIPVHALTSRCPLLSVEGNLEFSTRVPLAEQVRQGDRLYIVQSGDKLPVLAYKFYGDAKLWWVLYDVNASKILGHPLDLEPGTTLRAPDKQVIELEITHG